MYTTRLSASPNEEDLAGKGGTKIRVDSRFQLWAAQYSNDEELQHKM